MAASVHSLSRNLSELDNLLQDLSYVQCQKDRRDDESPAPSPAKRLPAGIVSNRMTDSVVQEMESKIQQHEVRRHVVQEEHREEVIETWISREPSHGGAWEYKGCGVWQKEAASGCGGAVASGPKVSGASNATQELDDLMASLNSFRMRDGGGGEECDANGPSQNSLDEMLGSLQKEMSKQGVKTTAKGVCFACDKPIVGQMITALGHTFHPEHFVCSHCDQELGSRHYFERMGKAYCEQDYHHLFSPRCAACDGAIVDRCTTAFDKTWHPEHFVCASCDKPFGAEGFHDHDGQPFCPNCFLSLFAPKCAGCEEPIVEQYIWSCDAHYHPKCFVCHECGCSFQGTQYFEHQGKPYCDTHFHALRGSLCAGCQRPISGRCITAMSKKFHPEHFLCSFCLKQLNKGTFKEHGDKPYCHDCFERLYR